MGQIFKLVAVESLPVRHYFCFVECESLCSFFRFTNALLLIFSLHGLSKGQ